MPATEDISDKQLTEAIRASDGAAFKVLYFRYYEALFRFVLRRTGEYETAKDLTQDTFTRVWQNRRNLDSGQSIKAYFYRAANNLAINHLKKKVLRQADSLENHKHIAAVSNIYDFETEDKIGELLNSLPEKERVVFTLNRFEGLKYVEIAGVLGVSIKTVEKHMSRALKSLRGSFKHLMVLLITLGDFLVECRVFF